MQPRAFAFTLHQSVALKHKSFGKQNQQKSVFLQSQTQSGPYAIQENQLGSHLIPHKALRPLSEFSNPRYIQGNVRIWLCLCFTFSFEMNCGNTGAWKGGGFGKQSVMVVTLVANNNTRGHVSAAVKVPQEITNPPF